MISIEGLTFRYGGGEFELRIPELTLEAGSLASVIGPSGSGKTTLLHLVAGIRRPEAGRVTVDGVRIDLLGEAARREFRISRIGLVFQEFELVDHLNVLDNILLPFRITAALRLDRQVRARAEDLAGRVGLERRLHRSIRKLSQGERQRVAVCRALLADPPLILADEPTGNLDPGNRDRVLDILFSYARETGATLLTVTHDHGLLDRFDRVIDAEGWGRG